MNTHAGYPGPTVDNLAALPAALKALKQWVLWRGEDRVNETTGEIHLNKIPINPHDLTKADTTDPLTWGSFATCSAALPLALEEWETENPDAYRGGGLGFVFTDQDPYCGIDLDSCVDTTTGAIAPWAQAYVDALASYTEITPSTTGLHILVQGTLPPRGRKKGQVEMYSERRFFTMTGWYLDETPPTVEVRQEALTALHADVFGAAEPRQAPSTPGTVTLEDSVLLTKARAAKNRTKFIRLYDDGDWTQDYASQSNAEEALCNLLAFWTQDAAQIDRLFRLSALLRPKWDSPRRDSTYGAGTITAALAWQTEHYTHREDFHVPTLSTRLSTTLSTRLSTTLRTTP